MEVGEVRVAEDADFERLKQLCRCHDGWKQDYNKNNTTVWTKVNDVSDFKMIKVRSVFKDVSAATLYDVLHDPQYRKTWDTNMLEGYEICCLNPNNDIGYYALKTPKPLKNRDFVIQRSWLETQKEYLIVNHSVNHTSLPPKKGLVRGISYITGYFISPLGDQKNEPGCVVSYVTQSDPKGKLPSWVVNKVTQLLAPKIMNKMHKASRGYESWKAKHNPHFKPWLYPEQISLPRLNMSEISTMVDCQSMDSLDESSVLEEDVKDEELEALNGCD